MGGREGAAEMIVVFDTETYLIRPGRQAPRIVCGQFCEKKAHYIAWISPREDALDTLESHLNSGATIVGHFIAYDMACAAANEPRLLPLIFKAYAEGRIISTSVREQLIRIAMGTAFQYRSHGLLESCERWGLDTGLTKEEKSAPNAWRLRYAELDGVPVESWPAEATRYALNDPRAALLLYQAQEAMRSRGWLEDEAAQSRAEFVLYLLTCWGMRVDQRAVVELAKALEEDHARYARQLLDAGLLRPAGTKNTKAAKARMLDVCREKDLPLEITKTAKDTALTVDQAIAGGYIALDKDACDAAGDEILTAYYKYASVEKTRNRLGRLARAGDLPIQPRYHSLKETGRTSASTGEVDPGKLVSSWGDAVQNLDRAPGLRECYIARPGFALCSVDWTAAELHSLAQCCLDMGIGSELAKVLNARRDPHLELACLINGWAYDWAKAALRGEHGEDNRKRVKDARQASKAANFGFPGGLGARKFRVYAARQYKVQLSEREAYALRDGWLQKYPEMTAYFAEASRISYSGEPLIQTRSGRRRGGLHYTEAANTRFQGLTADMAKDAGFYLAQEAYCGSLRGSRLWYFGHDEWIMEHPLEEAHERAHEQATIQNEAGAKWCPDVPCRAEPALMLRWRKEAERVERNGVLIPWELRDLSPELEEKIRKSTDNPLRASWRYGIEEERVIAIRRAA